MSNLFGLNQIENFRSSLDERSQNSLSQAINKITEVKRNGGKIMVVTGSGPNIHEGVTTLIAELIRVGIVDAVSTSSAVIAHEMAGSLDKVFRVDAKALGMDMSKMPRGDVFEFTSMSDEEIEKLKLEMPLDEDIVQFFGEDAFEVIEAVQTLPLPDRYAVYLFYYEGYSIKEIGQLLKEPEGTVSSRLSRVRKKLRILLEGGTYGRQIQERI